MSLKNEEEKGAARITDCCFDGSPKRITNTLEGRRRRLK